MWKLFQITVTNKQWQEGVFLNLTSRMHELRPESTTKILFYWSFTLLNCYQSTPGWEMTWLDMIIGWNCGYGWSAIWLSMDSSCISQPQGYLTKRNSGWKTPKAFRFFKVHIYFPTIHLSLTAAHFSIHITSELSSNNKMWRSPPLASLGLQAGGGKESLDCRSVAFFPGCLLAISTLQSVILEFDASSVSLTRIRKIMYQINLIYFWYFNVFHFLQEPFHLWQQAMVGLVGFFLMEQVRARIARHIEYG